MEQSRRGGRSSCRDMACRTDENGHGGDKDYMQAYKWYDIAAAIHAAEIDKLPPGAIESNQQEINYRDYVARQMTTTQIADAQKLAREWSVRHTTKRSR
jgi:TPR repeat protein